MGRNGWLMRPITPIARKPKMDETLDPLEFHI